MSDSGLEKGRKEFERLMITYCVQCDDWDAVFTVCDELARTQVKEAVETLEQENAALRKRLHHLEKHNQYFFRCESGWCNPSGEQHGNPALETLKQLEQRAITAENAVKEAVERFCKDVCPYCEGKWPQFDTAVHDRQYHYSVIAGNKSRIGCHAAAIREAEKDVLG